MSKELVNKIMREMLKELNNSQLKSLERVLNSVLENVTVSEIIDVDKVECCNGQLINEFLSAKEVEGCSIKTIEYYRSTIDKALAYIRKDFASIDTKDIRKYLSEYQLSSGASKVTVDNVRRILSSFFGWLEDEDYIIKSPVRRIKKIKTPACVKSTLSDEDLEVIKDNCKEIRDLAMIEMLASTGMRVGELVLLNREDIDFSERECVVFGKGSKERIVYFDARTKVHLQEYLSQRKDDNSALFVSLRYPYNRITIGGVESRIKMLGAALGGVRVYPHKFRRTLATMAIDKGMPIEQLQHLLGHKRIDTTLHYAMVKQSNVKIAHRKYVG